MSRPAAPIDRRNRLRALRLAVAASVVVAGLGVVAGCDDEPEDAVALRSLRSVVDRQSAGEPDRAYLTDLETLRGNPNLSDSTAALVDRVSGDARLAEANDILIGSPAVEQGEQGVPGLLDLHLRSVRLAEGLNAQARTLATMASTQKQLGVSSEAAGRGVQAMSDKAEQIRTGDRWSPAAGETDGNGPYAGLDGELSDLDRQGFQAYRDARASIAELQMLAVKGVEAELATLQGKAGEIQQQIDDLESQRREKLATAGGRERTSMTDQGDDAVASAREVADLNIEAGQFQQEIIVLTRQLNATQRDITLLEARVTSLQAAATMLEEQAESIRQSFDGADGLATVSRQVTSEAQVVLAGRGEAEAGMSAMAQELAEVRQEADDVRGQVLDALAAAESAYASAADRAGKSRGRATTPAAQLAADSLTAASASAKLALADIRRQVGELKIAQATVELSLLRLSTMLEAAPSGLDVSDVQAVTEDAADTLERVLSEAATALQEAGDAAASVSSSDADLRRAATVQQALALGHMLDIANLVEAARSMNAGTGITVSLPDTSELQSRLATLASDAESSGMSLPIIRGLNEIAGDAETEAAGTEPADEGPAGEDVDAVGPEGMGDDAPE